MLLGLIGPAGLIGSEVNSSLPNIAALAVEAAAAVADGLTTLAPKDAPTNKLTQYQIKNRVFYYSAQLL